MHIPLYNNKTIKTRKDTGTVLLSFQFLVHWNPLLFTPHAARPFSGLDNFSFLQGNYTHAFVHSQHFMKFFEIFFVLTAQNFTPIIYKRFSTPKKHKKLENLINYFFCLPRALPEGVRTDCHSREDQGSQPGP